jgi:SAM-dependent methyltransferase
MGRDNGEMMVGSGSTKPEVKQQVREFYDQIGWQEVSQGVYQNAHYEDLRPVSHEYIHRCHLRVLRHLNPQGRLLLDAGSGPIQYPEYLEYSRGYRHRVCADISIVALQEARQRIGEHGLYVVADVANLPFKEGVFDGVVSLHTIHHLPESEHLGAYREIYRLMSAGGRAVVVNGWPYSRLMKLAQPLMRLSNRLRGVVRRLRDLATGKERAPQAARKAGRKKGKKQKGTFTSRHGVSWIKSVVGSQMPVEILVWRSVSVRFLRTLIHTWNGGRYWLRLLYWLEERWPHYFGEQGQYPLILIRKD